MLSTWATSALIMTPIFRYSIFAFELDYYDIDLFTFNLLPRVSALLVIRRTGIVPRSVWAPSLILREVRESTYRSISKRAKKHLTPVSILRHNFRKIISRIILEFQMIHFFADS